METVTIIMRITKVACCFVAMEMMARTESKKLKGLGTQARRIFHHLRGLAVDKILEPC